MLKTRQNESISFQYLPSKNITYEHSVEIYGK